MTHLNKARSISTASLLLAPIAYYFWQRWRLPLHDDTKETTQYKPLSNLRPKTVPPQAQHGSRPLQLLSDGVGKLYHRRYAVTIRNPKLTPTALMQAIQSDFNGFMPQELAQAEKTIGSQQQMQVGDEYLITISAPWNAPVRVIDVQPDQFTLLTLEGHLETGEIAFRTRPHPNNRHSIQFEIVSWARSRDWFVKLAYEDVGVAKAAQTGMWAFFCNQVVEASGGERDGEIVAETQEVEFPAQNSGAPKRGRFMRQRPTLQARRAELYKRHIQHVEMLQDLQLNYDDSLVESFNEVNGWHIDSYDADLLSEQPGKPQPDGSFAAAKAIMLAYEFPDPSIVTGIFASDAPLENRAMLIEGRFWWMKFYFGVRVSRVIDEVRNAANDPVSVWGYSYQTLEGHWEMGEITFEVRKRHRTGEVTFRIDAVSKTGHIPNPFYRLGFAIFGRNLQIKFSRRACERMQEMVAARVQRQPRQLDVPQTKNVPLAS